MQSCPARGRAVLLSVLLGGGAAAQIPPASPAAILHVPAAQVPDGATSTLGLAARLDLTRTHEGRWSLREQQAQSDLLIALSGWDRVALDIVVPLSLRAGAPSANPWTRNRVTVGPVFLGGGVVLARRPAGARGIAAALRVGSALPLDDFGVDRFDTELGVAVDVLLARDILLAGYAAVGGSARYGLKEPAFQSFGSGVGLRLPLGDHLDVLADLWGRVDAFGGLSVRAEASVGLRGRIGHVFIIGSAGASLTDPALLFRLAVHAGAGDGLLPPAERDDVEPPEHGCVDGPCTPQQRAAVARAHAAHLDALRERLIALAGLIELRFRAHVPASGERAIVRLTIPNDLSIANDAARKRELSIRFLVGAFTRGGVPIDRATADALLDRTGWRVQVERDIDEPRVDYFTFDLPKLAAAYAGLLRDDAARLREAIAALRAAGAGTTEIFLDIGRGHVNGLIGVVNGLLDLPLAGFNLVQFIRDRPGFHLGRIPHLEYRSDWGRRNGAAMELGVALGTMTAPGSAIFAGLGNTVAPAVMRIGAELSAIVWRGLPVGKILAALLVRWMEGSVLAVKVHAAVDAGEIVRALVTGLIRLPDGSHREMTADDFEQLVFAFIQDAAVAKAALESKSGVEDGAEARWTKRSRSWREDPEWQLPRNGTWSGEPGASSFKPSDPARLGLGPEEQIEFIEGSPDLGPWMVEEFEVPGLNGEHPIDMPLIHRTIAGRKGWSNRDGSPNASAALDWLRQRNLTPHHAEGHVVQLVPRRLHRHLAHTGGAYKLRTHGK